MTALKGIKIIEFSRMPISSFATMIMGDFGAEVIKVDGTNTSPKLRGSIPAYHDKDLREGLHYPFNRNKKSVAINVKSEEGKRVFLQLVEQADVLVEGFRPGVMKRLGFHYEALSQLNSRIIYCSITGYGQDGPYQDMPGHDLNYLGVAGVLSLIGDRDGKPTVPLNFLADYAGGSLHATIGILLALSARERTNKGQYVDISMTDGVMSLISAISKDYFAKGVIPRRGVGHLSGTYPYYRTYKTKDDEYVAIGCMEPEFWERLCRELGREDLFPYHYLPEHASKSPEGEKWNQVSNALEAIFLKNTSDEWIQILGKKNIPITKVYHLNEVFSDPQVQHRGMIADFKHTKLGDIKQVGVAIKLSDTPGAIKKRAPILGEHTDMILSELGYTEKSISELRKSGVIL